MSRRLVHDAGFWCECAEGECNFGDPQGPCFAKLDQRNGERRTNTSIAPVDWCCPGLDMRETDRRTT